MRLVIQRVKHCKVIIDSKVFSETNKGLLCYVGVSKNDTEKDIKWAIDKMLGLRIFEDNDNKMNLSVKDTKGEVMLVSQFTLFGDVRKGKRPGFSDAAPIEMGKELFEDTVKYTKTQYGEDNVKCGKFQAMMEVEYINEGPVTILVDSEKNF
jgi:D-aminoacyl-tRNA deacylase